MSEALDVRLARIEERLQYVAAQLEVFMVEARGAAQVQSEIVRHRQKLEQLQAAMYQARGMVVIVSALVAFFAAVVPEILFR